MKRVRLDRCATFFQPPRNPRLHLVRQVAPFSHHSRAGLRRQGREGWVSRQCEWGTQQRGAGGVREASSAAAQEVEEEGTPVGYEGEEEAYDQPEVAARERNAPHHSRARDSAKLAALHARLALPSKLPLQTLARCLIDPSVDPRQGYNNEPFSILGQELLGYYTTEWLMTRYPRLPMPVMFAAQYAYVGSEALASLREEWGVEVVAAPGREVDPGLLQLKRVTPGNAMDETETMRVKHMPRAQRVGSGRKNEEWHYRRGMSSRIVYDDEFGDLHNNLPTPASDDTPPYPSAPISIADDSTSRIPSSKKSSSDTDTSSHDPNWYVPKPTTDDPRDDPATNVQAASATFVRALTGALYLHAGAPAASTFHTQHILSRHLPLHTLFHFSHPTRDLSRLCAREDFEPPVARLISETGRLSRTPVFIVGVFSGDEKLGEGAGASLNEARVRAAAAALRGWYLYSPPEGEVMRPSSAEGVAGKDRKWRAQMVDIGEIIT